MNKKSDNADDVRRWSPIVVALIGALLGGGSGTYLYLDRAGSAHLQEIARPDPFTGTQGRSLEERLNTVERRVDQLPPRELELAVRLLRHDLDEIERRIEKLENEH